MSHTPGPWNCQPISDRVLNHHGGFVIQAQGGKQRFIYPVPEAEIEANARLIAAAPELLEACLEARGWFKNDGAAAKVRAKLDASIAKAEGK